MTLEYSFVIPVYNRPDEVRELLESFLNIDFGKSYEIVIIEDGSTISSENVVNEYKSLLNISYYYKPNSGPGDSRNFGMNKAKGNYFIILDSDVILPPDYLQEVDTFLQHYYTDCFGGPDAAHPNFSNLQKAINYSMTSLWTTGGIRGKITSTTTFQPRSFNMGLSKKAFLATGGFGKIHPGEDPDLSLRLRKAGFKTLLLPGAVVFHKRRIDWNKFYTQVHKFGMVRPILNNWHPGSGKITYWFPTIFILGLAFAILLLLVGNAFLISLYALYFLWIGLDATYQNKNIEIGVLAIVATLIQFYGYGTGFLKSVWKLNILKENPEIAFPKLFFRDA